MKASIVIAVETYGDPQVAGVPLAEADARELAAVLELHGFAADNRVLLINEEASKTAAESKIRRTLKGLDEGDTLYLLYAGQGFSSAGESYLALFDTQPTDPEETSIRLGWLFDQLRACRCQQIVLLLDANHGRPFSPGAMGSLDSGLNEGELQNQLDSLERSACFVSCRSDEISHRSGELKHGIWAYHLIEGLDGRAKSSLQGTRLTAGALQEHLGTLVPRTLRKTSAEGKQTPWMYAPGGGNVVVADLEDIVAAREGSEVPTASQIKSMTLLSETRASIRSLAGFKKRDHHIPDRASESAQQFINTITAADLQNELDVVHAALKGAFRFKRADLDVSNHGEGAGTITTPYFNYNVSIHQDPDDPAGIVWRRTVDAIREPDQVLSPAFQQVFEKRFNTLDVTLHGGVDLEELIDRIEGLETTDIQVDYSTDLTTCQIRLQGVPGAIHVTRRTFALVYPKPEPPRALLESFLKIQRALAQTHDVALPFEPPEG